jgi:HD-GYP domain-containing protein (c-di-GMP phosphodiesterase class II)
MIADRPCRTGIPASEALTEVRRRATTRFDPLVLAAFAGVVAALNAVR